MTRNRTSPMTSILFLPAEVLIRIFEHVGHRLSDLMSLSSISQVCKVWHKLVEPILYHSLRLIFQKSELYDTGSRKSQQLLKTLDRKPWLCEHVRRLFLDAMTGTMDDIPGFAILEVTASRLKTLHIGGNVPKYPAAQWFERIATMSLDELSISNEWSERIIKSMFQHHGCCQLRSLAIVSYHDSRAELLDFNYTLQTCPLSSVQTLDLQVAYWPISVLKVLLKATKSLRSFKLNVTHSWVQMSVTLDSHFAENIQQLLNVRKDTLEKIELAEMFEDNPGQSIDISNFGVLKELSLHYRNCFPQTPADACARLSSSTLEHLIIDMEWGHCEVTGFERIYPFHVDWLHDFVSLQKSNPGSASALRHIHINYHMIDEGEIIEYLAGTLQVSQWPFSNLQRAADLVRGWGVHLSWPEPELDVEDRDNRIAEYLQYLDPVDKDTDIASSDKVEPSQQLICVYFLDSCMKHSTMNYV